MSRIHSHPDVYSIRMGERKRGSLEEYVTKEGSRWRLEDLCTAITSIKLKR